MYSQCMLRQNHFFGYCLFSFLGVYFGLTLFVFLHFTTFLEKNNSNTHGITQFQLMPGRRMPIHHIDGQHHDDMEKSHQQRNGLVVLAPVFSKHKAQQALLQHGAERIRQPITAFLEKPMQDIIPSSRNQGAHPGDVGIPPEYIIPLPLRTQAPKDLVKVVYPKFQSCHTDLPSKLPVDRGYQLVIVNKTSDGHNNKMEHWNAQAAPDPLYNDLKNCPVNGDPFLPWIHDIVPSHDGTKIQFVAQNKRRCISGDAYRDWAWDMQPQVALFQHVSIKRVNRTNAQRKAPALWQSSNNDEESFYQLVPMEDADTDGKETRFICRFHMTSVDTNTLGQLLFAGETLSAYPFNYEFVSYRRLHPTMLNPRGMDHGSPYLSTLLFHCPVPQPLQHIVASGESVLSDGTPMLHVDLIPIRTSPRYGTSEIYLSEEMIGPKQNWHLGNVTRVLWRKKEDLIPGFDPKKRWGKTNILPAVQASGRWTNLPICQPPLIQQQQQQVGEEIPKANTKTKKHYELVACVWASESYSTRGAANLPMDTSTVSRFREWLEFAFLVGFDHVYVYDNSAANTQNGSLTTALEPFGTNVSIIEWPHVVCNNNKPTDKNCGERSSQYAAENSCRTRFGPHTDWIASFDVDEYLIPMGSYQSLKEVVRNAYSKGNKIVSFRSTRTKLRLDQSEVIGPNTSRRRKKKDALFVEAYNCDTDPGPKPDASDRARKEIYRADHVLYHFVHYSLVTKDTIVWYKEDSKHWKREIQELAPPPYITDEFNEAVMLHTKVVEEEKENWDQMCSPMTKNCAIGFPQSLELRKNDASSNNVHEHNCYTNIRLSDYWIPKLKEAMIKRLTTTVAQLG